MVGGKGLDVADKFVQICWMLSADDPTSKDRSLVAKEQLITRQSLKWDGGEFSYPRIIGERKVASSPLL